MARPQAKRSKEKTPNLLADSRAVSQARFQYYLPTRILFGVGTLSQVPLVVASFSHERVLLVTGQSAMKRVGVVQQLQESLPSATLLYKGIGPNPPFETVNFGLSQFQGEGIELVIGLGGGSVIDIAKSLAILIPNGGRVEEYLLEDRKIYLPGLPVIAIPTTSGPGSEVTPWATVWDKSQKRKHSLSHEFMFPTAAVVDPVLLLSLPPYETAVTGLDALTQATEAFWSVNSQPISSGHALTAIGLILGHLERALSHPQDLDTRTQLAFASLSAGLAFSNTRTTICHALSYPMTAHFGVPHGLAVALTLPSFLVYNSLGIGKRVKALLDTMGVGTVEEGAERLRQFMKRLGVPTRLSQLGIGEDDLAMIAQEGLGAERAQHNPVPVSLEDARKVLREVL